MNESLIALLEHERKKLLPPIILCIVIAATSFLTFLFNPFISIIGLFFVLLLFFLRVNIGIKDYKKLYKDTVVAKQFLEAFPDCSYQPANGISKEEIHAAGLIMLGNRYRSEDYITGTYKGVRFERSDLLIQNHHSDSNGHSHTTTYFQGRWMVFQAPKRFHTTLQIIQKNFSYSNQKKGLFTSKEERRHEVEFENEQFNSQFNCYCQNDQEAYYLITPQMQEAILKLAQLIDGSLMLGFTGQRLHLAVNTGKDALEPSIFHAISYQNDFLAVKQEISAITDIINVLNLDCKIYKTT